MRSAFFLFLEELARPGGGADLVRFPLLNYVGKLVDHQLVSPADLPTKLSWMANGTYGLVVSRESCRLTALEFTYVGDGIVHILHIFILIVLLHF